MEEKEELSVHSSSATCGHQSAIPDPQKQQWELGVLVSSGEKREVKVTRSLQVPGQGDFGQADSVLSQPPQCLCHLAVPKATATHSEHREKPRRAAMRPPATESDLVLCALVTVGTRQRLQQRLPSPPAGDSWSSRYHWFLTLSTMCPHEAMEAVGQRG